MTIQFEIRTKKDNAKVAELILIEGSYEHILMCKAMRAVCLKGFLDKASNKDLVQAMDDVRYTFCPGCSLRPGTCQGIW